MRPAQECRRCGQRLTEGGMPRGFCSSDCRREGRIQLRALRAAGAGCGQCFRGAVFFEWRAEGGRQQRPVEGLMWQWVAPCWCVAGQRICLPGGYKTWGRLRDFDLSQARVIAPLTPPLSRVGQLKA